MWCYNRRAMSWLRDRKRSKAAKTKQGSDEIPKSGHLRLCRLTGQRQARRLAVRKEKSPLHDRGRASIGGRTPKQKTCLQAGRRPLDQNDHRDLPSVHPVDGGNHRRCPDPRTGRCNRRAQAKIRRTGRPAALRPSGCRTKPRSCPLRASCRSIRLIWPRWKATELSRCHHARNGLCTGHWHLVGYEKSAEGHRNRAILFFVGRRRWPNMQS